MVDGTKKIIDAVTLALYRNSHVRKVVSAGAGTGRPCRGRRTKRFVMISIVSWLSACLPFCRPVQTR
jgi:hypothetical protein